MFVESLTCLMIFKAQKNPNTKVGLSSAHSDRSDVGKKKRKKKGGESDKKPKDVCVLCANERMVASAQNVKRTRKFNDSFF